VLGSITDVDNWNEYLSRHDFAGKVLRRIYLRLAVPSNDGSSGPHSFEPQLAESWTVSEDGLSLTFRLREARWSDGTAITTADVRFTWQAQTSEDVAWIGAANKQHIEDVETIDERTVVFHFDRPYTHQLADAVEGGILPQHVFGRVPFEDWRTHDWSATSVASGPFKLERHQAGQEIVLARNERYYRDGHPRIDRVVIRIVPDTANLLTQMLSGEIDYLEGLAPRDAERLRPNGSLKLIGFDYPKYDFIGWNGARAPFDDVELRRALTLAIDREALVEDLLYGYGRVSRGPVVSSSWGADSTLTPWPHDPDRARRILAERGFASRTNDGTLSDGKTLEFDLITNAGNKLREMMAVKIQDQLGRIGVRVHIRVVEMGTLIEQCMAGEFDAYLGGWTVLGKVDLEPIFGSESMPPRGANVVHYRSDEVDRLLAAIDEAADWRELKPLLDQVQRRIHDEQPYTFLYETQRIAVTGPRLSGMSIEDPSDPLRGLEDCRTRPS